MNPQPSKIEPARKLGKLVLWCIIVLCGAAYGLLQSAERATLTDRLEPMVGFGAVGVGAASLLVIGVILLGLVRTRRLARGWAVLALLLSSAMSVLVPGFIAQVIASLISHPTGDPVHSIDLFRSEHAGWMLIAGAYMFWLAVIVFLVFAFCILVQVKGKKLLTSDRLPCTIFRAALPSNHQRVFLFKHAQRVHCLDRT